MWKSGDPGAIKLMFENTGKAPSIDNDKQEVREAWLALSSKKRAAWRVLVSEDAGDNDMQEVEESQEAPRTPVKRQPDLLQMFAKKRQDKIQVPLCCDEPACMCNYSPTVEADSE